MTDASEVATTGSNAAPPATRKPDRLERLGYAGPKLRERNELKELNAKQRLLIEYMTHGCRHEFVQRIGKLPGEPLSLIEAADLLHIRRRNARALFSTPVFKKELGLEIERLRSGEALASLRTVIAIRDEPGEGKAADRKVRLEAARDLLGEAVGKSAGVSVAVNVNTTVQAGYVLDLTPQAGRTIEGQAE